MDRTTVSSSNYLVPQGTVVRAPGQGECLKLGPLAGKSVLLVLHITDVIEQESLDVSIWGSEDGQSWAEKPLFSFPQQFYQGDVPAAVHLNLRPEIKFLKAHWTTNRFGRGYAHPYFRFSLEVQDLD